LGSRWFIQLTEGIKLIFNNFFIVYIPWLVLNAIELLIGKIAIKEHLAHLPEIIVNDENTKM